MSLFANIHNKKNWQSVMLSSDQEKEWLKEDLEEEEIRAIFKEDFDEDQLEYYPVIQDLFYPKTNSNVEDILDKVEYE